MKKLLSGFSGFILLLLGFSIYASIPITFINESKTVTRATGAVYHDIDYKYKDVLREVYFDQGVPNKQTIDLDITKKTQLFFNFIFDGHDNPYCGELISPYSGWTSYVIVLYDDPPYGPQCEVIPHL